MYKSSLTKLSQFTANKKIFLSLCDEIDCNMGASIPQPVLIIGQAGSGKTRLLKRIIQQYRSLNPLCLDGRTIFCTADIISLINNSQILIIDNLDYYLKRCSYTEQYKLRKVLYNEGAPMLIASVSKLTPALTEYKAPFFEGLKKLHIPPITAEDMKSLFDEKVSARAMSMFSLTSPTIRSAEFISCIIETNPQPQNDIDLLLSYYSDKYNYIYQSVPKNSQYILNVLGRANSGLTIPEIRDKTNLTSGILTSYLKNLCLQGYVATDKSVKRKTRYFVNDPLFKIWLQKF